MLDRERVVALIKTTYPFHKLDDNLIKLVVDSLEPASISKGQRIYREGFPSDLDSLCIVLDGKVRLTREVKGETQTVAILNEGEMFGHEMLESNFLHPVSSFADTDITLLKLNRVNANVLVEKIPTFTVSLRVLFDSYMILLNNRFKWKGADESIYYVAHRHPLWLWERAIIPIFCLIFTLTMLLMITLTLPNAAGGFIFLMILDVLFFLGWLKIIQMDWENDIVAVTSQRVLFQERKLIFYEAQQEAPLNAVLSVATETTQVGRVIRYGTVVVRTYAGSISLPMLSFPEHVAAFLELQWGKSKSYRTRAEAASMENIIRNRLGYGKGGGTAPGKPVAKEDSSRVMKGIENWIANLLQLKVETATGTIYHTHWIVLFERAIIPILLFLTDLTIILVVLFNILNFPGGAYAALVLTLFLLLALMGLGFWIWYRYEDWVNDLYIITNDQIVDRVKKPFGKEDRKVAPLKNIQSVEFERGGLLGIAFNYGSVKILVGESQMVFKSVFNPSDIQRELFKRMAEREFKEKQTARETEQKWVIDWIAAYHNVMEQEKKSPPGTGFK
jgi:hypothetical protein